MSSEDRGRSLREVLFYIKPLRHIEHAVKLCLSRKAFFVPAQPDDLDLFLLQSQALELLRPAQL